MFDVGFWELVVLFVIGLIILGPERLPQVAIKVGNWAGQARRMVRHLSNQVRSELDDFDVNDPFTTNSTGGPSPGYKRPGVDDLKPSTAPDASPKDQSSNTDAEEEPSGKAD